MPRISVSGAPSRRQASFCASSESFMDEAPLMSASLAHPGRSGEWLGLRIIEEVASSHAGSLVAKLAGKFRQKTIHRNGRVSEELWQQLVDRATLARRVVLLQINQRIDLPRRHALLLHGLALRFDRDVHILHSAAGMLGDFLRQLDIG